MKDIILHIHVEWSVLQHINIDEWHILGVAESQRAVQEDLHSHLLVTYSDFLWGIKKNMSE